MSRLSAKFARKFHKIARIVDADKQLYFFGVLQHETGPWDRWDVVVSAKKLRPRSIAAIEYLAKLLKKELSLQELIQIAQVVALPRDHEVIASLSHDDPIWTKVRRVRSLGHSEEAVVFFPVNESVREATKV
jgi:hypothetical protein